MPHFKPLITLLLSTGLLLSCGGGTDSSSNTTAASSSSSATLASTVFITNYLTLYHAQEFEKFSTAENSLSTQLSASGEFQSDTHYAQSKTNYQATVDGFVNGALLFIQTTAQQMPVDKTLTIALMNDFKTTDIAYANSYYSSANWGMSGTKLDTLIGSLQTDVEKSYSLMILTIYIP